MKQFAVFAIFLLSLACAGLGQTDLESGTFDDPGATLSDESESGTDSESTTTEQESSSLADPAVPENQNATADALPPQPPVVRLFIGRPNSFGFGRGGKNLWIAPLLETFLYLRLSAVSPVKVIPFETVRAMVADANDYRRHIAHQSSMQAVRGAKPVISLSTEYETISEGRFRVSLRLAAAGTRGAAQERETSFDLANMDDSLTVAIKALIAGINKAGWSLSAKMGGQVLPRSAKALQRTGEAALKGFRENPRASATALERLYREDNRNICALYTALLLHRSIKATDREALGIEQTLAAGRAKDFPVLALMESELLRRGQRLQEARNAVSRAAAAGCPKYLLLPEQARIEEALGDFSAARSTYDEAVRIDEHDPDPYRGMARICMLQGDADQAKSLIAQWATLTSRSPARTLCEVGAELAEMNRIDAAVAAYRLCVEDSSDNAQGWQALGDALRNQGRDSAAAESYLRLFEIDHARYRDAPLMAGEMFEKAGHLQRAREAYETLLAKRRGDTQAIVRLARLDYHGGKCDAVIKRLRPLASSGVNDSSIAALLSACNAPEVDETWTNRKVAPGEGPQRRPLTVVRNVLSVSLGLLAAASFGAGIYLNSDITPLHERYADTRDADEIDRLHNDLTTTRDNRNRLYIASACLAGGFALTILLPGR